MSIVNNKFVAAFNVSVSVISTALIIGILSSDRPGNSDLAKTLISLIITDFITILTATYMILSILTKNKQNQ
ncbi:TPA: hypothetical protein ACGY9K_002604 [Escherichia coli]|uniref:hypothetical protein n=1 Tax=Citrobacter freundii complex sp. 2024EL-00748 TaxID=3382813 RepID=UPI00126DF2DC|nr:hypothetical protein [Salmonella enterica subsp. enterica serovar Anatum]ECL5445075.1 hypothetical protein [Salmonella enterica]EDM7166759.1 hypothetical protein [Salmonella enterica subsp. enterica serovar Litchfield]EFE0694106.1 hypothetical protein [Escherichia coli]EJN7219144.1 hypothetical protein [Citrobacter freundii]